MLSAAIGLRTLSRAKAAASAAVGAFGAGADHARFGVATRDRPAMRAAKRTVSFCMALLLPNNNYRF